MPPLSSLLSLSSKLSATVPALAGRDGGRRVAGAVWMGGVPRGCDSGVRPGGGGVGAPGRRKSPSGGLRA